MNITVKKLAELHMLCAAIKEAIERFEPRATYMGTTFKSSKDNPGTMLPVVEVSINA